MTLPATVWFCPDHFEEFWVPHGGQCPEPGCEQTLIAYYRPHTSMSPNSNAVGNALVDFDPRGYPRVAEAEDRAKVACRQAIEFEAENERLEAAIAGIAEGCDGTSGCICQCHLAREALAISAHESAHGGQDDR